MRKLSSPPTWGIVRGESIHLDCSTEEEALLTWMRFASPEVAREGEKCPRCGKLLSEIPEP